jgi:hypothetical protein
VQGLQERNRQRPRGGATRDDAGMSFEIVRELRLRARFSAPAAAEAGATYARLPLSQPSARAGSMISDSIPWKDELLHVAERLRTKKTQRRWSARSAYLLERDVMMAAYAVRKLIESRRVSDELSHMEWPVARLELTGDVPDVWNVHEPERSFDLAAPQPASLSTLEVCHQIIHSFVFYPEWTWTGPPSRAGELKSINVASDRARHKQLYSIDLDVLVALFERVGDEEIVEIRVEANEAGERFYAAVVGAPRGDGSQWDR